MNIYDFQDVSTLHICIDYDDNVDADNIELFMKPGSARTIINGYKKLNIKYKIYFGDIPECIFSSFIKKHNTLSGKVTKSMHCWSYLKELIINKQAILVVCDDNYILFHISSRYNYYGINACDKKNKIVTYLLYEGIKWLHKNGYKFIHFNTYHLFETDEKMKNIAKFKQSFCNKMFTQYLVKK